MTLHDLDGSVVAGSSLVLTLIAVALALVAGYLVALSIAAAFGRRRRAPEPGPCTSRFAVLVPAHNEELVIGRLLASLRQLDYSPDHYDVCVVADNCSDATADIARSMGALVYEHIDSRERAKGFALRWLLSRLRDEGRQYDAYVVLDADSVVAGNLLRSLDARLHAGSQVIQVYYSVLNSQASAVASLRFAALAAVHYLRPMGRAAMGLSCGLKGNGMCFAAPVLDRFAWSWFTLTEDVEFHLALVREGIPVDFAPETSVLADMPVTMAQARSQNHRWERGRIDLLRKQVPALLAEGLRRRNLLRLDAAIEQLIPPLSVPFALGGACLVLAAALGAWWTAALAAAGLAAQVAYLAAGLALVNAPLRVYLSLSSAPVYVMWKVGLYGQALLAGGASAWVRTERRGN